MKTLLFVDLICYKPYSLLTLEQEALAGTEAMVVRIAESLGKCHRVIVAQHLREHDERGISKAHYLSWDSAKTQDLTPDIVIVIRKYQRFQEIATLYPGAKKYLWMHTMPKKSLRKYAGILRRHDATIIAVSHFHATRIRAVLHAAYYQKIMAIFRHPLPIIVKYNAITDTLLPDKTPVNPHKLLFLSSPIKGLEQVLAYFQTVKIKHPKVVLFVADPGYKIKGDTFARDALQQMPGIKVLGSLSHQEVIRELREAFCVFYPQNQFAETFGIVYAEANAVGTPVLAADIGAAKEVLWGDEQVIDIKQPNAVTNTLTKWLENGRPKVQVPDKFRLSSVVKDWMAMCE